MRSPPVAVSSNKSVSALPAAQPGSSRIAWITPARSEVRWSRPDTLSVQASGFHIAVVAVLVRSLRSNATLANGAESAAASPEIAIVADCGGVPRTISRVTGPPPSNDRAVRVAKPVVSKKSTIAFPEVQPGSSEISSITSPHPRCAEARPTRRASTPWDSIRPPPQTEQRSPPSHHGSRSSPRRPTSPPASNCT